MKTRWILCLLAVGVFLVFTTVPAFANVVKIGEYYNAEDDTVMEAFKYDGGYYFFIHYPDGAIVGYDVPDEGNPDPDDPNGIGGKPDIEELAKRFHRGTLGKPVRLNNPFSIRQSARGKGRDPRWNPPETVRDPDGSGGGSGTAPRDAEWIKDQARRGTGGDDDDDQGEQGGNNDRPGIGETGSVQPERVNPVPFLRGRSDVESVEGWQPPVEGVVETPEGSPVENPARTLTTTATEGEPPAATAVAPSGGGEDLAAGPQNVQGLQSPAVRPTLKTAPAAPAVRVQPVKQ